MALALLITMILHPVSYDEALAESIKTGKPLVVFCHADWCQPCRNMQAEMKKVRNIDLVAFADVDIDDEPGIADNGSIPQLIVKYRKDGKAIKKTYRGFRNSAQIEAIINDAHLQSVQKSDK